MGDEQQEGAVVRRPTEDSFHATCSKNRSCSSKLKQDNLKLPTHNFLLIKHIVDGENDGSLNLIGTLVQTVFQVPEALKQTDDAGKDTGFMFEYRFNDLMGDDYVKVRNRDVVKTKDSSGQELIGCRTTLQAKIPLENDTKLKDFPFHVMSATVLIELSSVSEGGRKVRPSLVVSKVDRRANVSLQDLKTEGASTNEEPPLEIILDKVDKTKAFDFVSPYPEIQYEYDTKKKYCPRYRVTFYVIKGGFTKFITMILPMVLVGVINTLNIINDSMEEEDTVSYLGVSSTLTLTVVFLLPQVIEPSARKTWRSLDNLYIGIIFFSLIMSSFPSALVGTYLLNYMGLLAFWASFVSPITSLFQYHQLITRLQRERRRVVKRAEANPYLKDDGYREWKPSEQFFDSYYVDVEQVAEEDADRRLRAREWGYENKEVGKTKLVSYL